ncbi:MAG: hypothetical protein AAFX94_25305, partial [Myxococcota bacterium]
MSIRILAPLHVLVFLFIAGCQSKSEPVQLESSPAKSSAVSSSLPVKIFILAGQSNAQGDGRIRLPPGEPSSPDSNLQRANGTLEHIVEN